MSCHTLWYQYQYWPDDWRHQEEVYRVCSHRVVGCILSVVSVYKENYTISDSVQHFNVLFKYCYLKVFEQSTPITYFALSRVLPSIGSKLVLHSRYHARLGRRARSCSSWFVPSLRPTDVREPREVFLMSTAHHRKSKRAFTLCFNKTWLLMWWKPT